ERVAGQRCSVDIPLYGEFAETGIALKNFADAFCANPAQAGLDEMREHYHAAMDSWQAIQHVQFGPVTYFNWNYRLQFWPDDNNTGARQLTALLAAQDRDVLAEENFARQSVGVQGFPALESLLFDDNSLQQFQADSYRCQLAQTIAANIGSIAEDVYQRWVDEFRASVANADDSDFFESAEDATIDFLKALIEPLPGLRDQKLALPLGESFARARDRRAESWRSQRSLRNLKINLQSLQELFSPQAGAQTALSDVFLPEDVAAVNAKFLELQPALGALPDSMVAALADEQGYDQLVAIQSQVDALYEALEAALKNTDLYLGFNSLDGD
ncbi:MAG: imelysin family protein, partial [Pseudohongiellaceae bacterium]